MNHKLSTTEFRLVNNQQELEEMYYQRWLVLRAPLGMPLGTEKDKHEETSFHIIAICHGKIIGSARLRLLSEDLGSIAYLAVIPEFRHQGIGTQLIQKLIEIARNKSLKSLRLMARVTTLDFYQRLGFEAEGEQVNYLNIPHLFMYYNLQPSEEAATD